VISSGILVYRHTGPISFLLQDLYQERDLLIFVVVVMELSEGGYRPENNFPVPQPFTRRSIRRPLS